MCIHRTASCHIPKACSLETNSKVIVLRVYSGTASYTDEDCPEGGNAVGTGKVAGS
jgi:hypothetical protein